MKQVTGLPYSHADTGSTFDTNHHSSIGHGSAPRTGERRYTTKAYLTFVGIDQDGKPCVLPPLVMESDDDRRRAGDGEKRRAQRLANRSA